MIHKTIRIPDVGREGSMFPLLTIITVSVSVTQLFQSRTISVRILHSVIMFLFRQNPNWVALSRACSGQDRVLTFMINVECERRHCWSYNRFCCGVGVGLGAGTCCAAVAGCDVAISSSSELERSTMKVTLYYQWNGPAIVNTPSGLHCFLPPPLIRPGCSGPSCSWICSCPSSLPPSTCSLSRGKTVSSLVVL